MTKKYTTSKSNYTLKGKPISVENGKIYDKDILTYTEGFGSINGNLTIRSEGGFTFITNTTPKEDKTYNNGELGQTYTFDDIILEEITNNNISEESISLITEKPKTYIDLQKTYNDLSKFTYFGSCNIFIKSAIEDIINRFPSGLYVYDLTYLSGNTTNTITLPLDNVNNDFEIDLLNYNTNNDYDLRVLSTSYKDFGIVLSGDTEFAKLTGFTTDNTNITFLFDKTVTVNNPFHIRPNTNKQEEFFNSLDDFQKTLLNRRTNPKYTSYIKIPRESEFGTNYENIKFTWTTTDGYNLDINSMDYVLFLQELINSSNFVDENYSDNLYRMLVHDSIKNLDNCYVREHDQDLLDEYIVGGTKMQKVIRLYGRNLDEVKKYSDGLSQVNNITYDKKENLPEQFLKDKLKLSGWETLNLTNVFTKTGETKTNIYPAISGTYKIVDSDFEVDRRLILNSPYIWRSKGTKKSIRKVMGLFGIDSDTYEIREYTQKLDKFLTGQTINNIIYLNGQLRPNEIENNYIEPKNPYQNIRLTGINVNTFVKCPLCGSENYRTTGTTEDEGICVENNHIFSITGNTFGYPYTRGNSNNFYFQQKGNWYRETGGYHVDLTGTTYVNEISTGNNPHAGYGSYDGGFDYIDQYNNLFKTDIREQDNTPLFDITGYTVGFGLTNKKTIDNLKINYNKRINPKTTKLIIGNYVIDDNTPEELIFDTFSTSPTIINSTGLTQSRVFTFYVSKKYNHNINMTLFGNAETLKIGETWLVSYDKLTNTWETNIIDNELNINLKNFVIGIDGDKLLDKFYSGNTVTTTGVTKTELYDNVKSTILPYLEQVIPSTTIFDFVLIDRTTPKWVLVDKYCDRNKDVNQNYNGKTILKYKNINYFDTGSTSYDSVLTNKIVTDFGVGFTYTGTTTGSMVGFDRDVLFIGDNGDCYRDTTVEWVMVEDLIMSSSWINSYLTGSTMVEDLTGGLCIKNKYTYYSYEKLETGCTCTDITSFTTNEINTGLYIQPYINTNSNFSMDTRIESDCLMVETITGFVETYIYDLATTGYTGYNGSNIEDRVIYETSKDRYFKIEHEKNSTNCTLNTDAMFAITDINTGEIYNGVGNYFYMELDDCGNETGNEVINLTDINPNSASYLQQQNVVICQKPIPTITIETVVLT